MTRSSRCIAFKCVCVCIVSIWLYGCAQKLQLTGGPKDSEAPFFEQSTPSQNQTEFTDDQITFIFNEFVQITSPEKKIVFSPPPIEKPSFNIGGKKLNINVKDKLEDNTTYQISFFDCINDITEQNPFEKKTFVFSTGPTIDSAIIKGRVLDAYSKKPIENALVYAFRSSSLSLDSAIKTRGDYLTKTNKNGQFTLSNLKQTDYSVFALIDSDENYIYNPNVESFGFSTQKQNTSDSNHITLLTFQKVFSSPLAFKEKKMISPGVIQLFFTDTLSSFLIKNHPLDHYHHTLSEKDSSVTITFLDTLFFNESFNLHLQLNDTLIDTLKNIQLSPHKKTSLDIDRANNQFTPFEPVILQFNEPIESFDSSKIEITLDSTLIAYRLEREAPKGFIVRLLTDSIAYNKSYNLKILPNALQSYYKKTNTDTLIHSLSVKDPKQFANLSVYLSDSSHTMKGKQKIAQLYNSGQKMIQKVVFQNDSCAFSNLEVGTYTLQLMVDNDKNKAWTSGDFSVRRLAEKVIYYPDINIQSGFDQDITWTIKSEHE